MILFLLTVCGASAGSTGGGVKISRLLIIVKKIKLDIQKLLHPQKVEAITMDGKVVDTEVVNQSWLISAALSSLSASYCS